MKPATARKAVKRPKPASARVPPRPADLATGLLLATARSSEPTPKPRSTSARAKPRDWEGLYTHVLAERDAIVSGSATIDWDERYVHAIERALVGRKSDELLELLDKRCYLHPSLCPLLADVLRSQKDGARGAGRRLTQRQDAVIRDVVDHMGDGADKIEWLARLHDVRTDLIRESLARTANPKKK